MPTHFVERGVVDGKPLWPFLHDWNETYDVTLEYKTDIITSRSGREQRRVLRETPRKRIAGQFLVQDDQLRAANRFFSVRHDNYYVLFDPTEFCTVTSGMPSSGFSISVDSRPSWLTVGSHVALVDGDEASPRKVYSVDGNDIVFEDSATGAWHSGTRVYRANKVWLDTRVTTTPRVNSVHTFPVTFNVEPGTENFPVDGEAQMTFDGKEVVLKRPNWGEAVSHEWFSGAESVDFEYGRVAHYLSPRPEIRTFKAVYLGKNLDESRWLVDLFRRHRGQLGEFYLPTFAPDLVLYSPLVPGAQTLTIGGLYDLVYADSTVFKALAIVSGDGNVYPNAVDAMEAVEGNTVISLKYPLSESIDPANVQMISWMPTCRFASDSATFQWVLPTVAKVQFAIRTLEDLP